MRPARYQVLGPLRAGEGSRAQLGLAIFDDGRAEPCVVVLVPEDAEHDAALLAKIEKETEHAALLDHRNIVTVFGFAKLEQGHARCVEFADGESLRRVLNLSSTLPVAIAARIVCDACTGVHYAHLAGNDDGTPLVHGDVRPETVLLSFAGATKVTGYGALAFAPKEIGGQRVKGRRVHSSPEQIIGGRDAITIASDVYLLGLTFYELLTGVVPWADQAEGFDQAVLTYPLPPATPGLIPEGLVAVLEKACQKKAPHRYATPLALREAIEEALGSQIATSEELASFLEPLFPGSGEIRAERKRTIDAGIADFARQQWRRNSQEMRLPSPSAPTPAPPVSGPYPPINPTQSASSPISPEPSGPQPVIAPPVPPAQPPPPPPPSGAFPVQPKPKPPAHHQPHFAVEDSRPGDDDDEPKRESSTPWVAFLVAIVVIISGYLAYSKANEPFTPKPRPEDERVPVKTVEIDAGLPTPVAVIIDAGEVDGGVEQALDAGQSAVDAGAAPKPVVDAGAPPPAVSELQVTIESRPNLELTIDGTPAGKTPWTGKLALGPHKLKLENKDLLISTGRTLTVQGEQPISQTYKFEKGTVTINAPAGAGIFIDGKKVGTAPLKEPLSIYEGFHRVLVKVGQAQWTETFTLFEGQKVNFNVELE